MAGSSALRRYNLTVLALSATYGIALIGAELLFKRHAVTGALAYVVAIAPALPIVGIFAAVGRYLCAESDEYVRMLTVRQSLIASGFALSIATSWGFLESFDLVGHVEAYYVAVLWFLGLGVGGCVNAFMRDGRHE